MKKFEEFTMEDLWALRQEIVLNSLFIADYENTFGIDAHSVCDFFDSFMSYAQELEKEDGFENETIEEFFDRYDTPENLWDWYWCYEDFSWVQYEEVEEEWEEAA